MQTFQRSFAACSAIVLTVLLLPACERPTSEKTLRLQLDFKESLTAKLRLQSAAPAPASSWGARAVNNVEELQCYAVAVTEAAGAANTSSCTTSAGTPVQFSTVSKFIDKAGVLEVDVPKDSTSDLLLLGMRLRDNGACPLFSDFDPANATQLLVLGKASVTPSENMTVKIAAGFGGDRIGDCTGPVIPQKRHKSIQCNSGKVGLSNPDLMPGHALLYFRRSQEFANPATEIPLRFPGVTAVIRQWPALAAYLVQFTPAGNLAEDFDNFCKNDELVNVEAMTELPATSFSSPYDPTNFIRGNRVAQIASGVSLTHDDLISSTMLKTNFRDWDSDGIDSDSNGIIDDYWIGYDFYNNSASPTDSDGYGTRIAGGLLIGAGYDLADNMPHPVNFRLIPINFLGDGGNGTNMNFVNSIEFAREAKVAVINIVTQAGGPNLLVQRSLALAQQEGILMISSAGDNGKDLNLYPSYPSAWQFPNTMTVGSLKFDGSAPAMSSNFGSLVNVFAIGSNVFSTTKPNSYANQSGTGVASAIVAGLAMTVKAAVPLIPMTKLREIIVNDYKIYGTLDLTRIQAAAATQQSIPVEIPLVFFPE